MSIAHNHQCSRNSGSSGRSKRYIPKYFPFETLVMNYSFIKLPTFVSIFQNSAFVWQKKKDLGQPTA